MPAYYKEQLTEEHLLQIMTFIKSLSPTKTQGQATAAPASQNKAPAAGAAPATTTTGANTKDAQGSNPVLKAPGNQK